TRCYRDWSSDVCSSDLLGKSEVLDLTSLNQCLPRASDILYVHVRVNPMLIQQVDGINLQPLERPFDGLLDVLGPTVQPCRSRPIIVATQIGTRTWWQSPLCRGTESALHPKALRSGTGRTPPRCQRT